jgi:hypothetical protein
MKKILLASAISMLVLFIWIVPAHSEPKWAGLQGIQSFELLTVYANPYDQDPAKTKQALKQGSADILAKNGLPFKESRGDSNVDKTRLMVLIGVIPQPFCGPSKLYEIEIVMQEPFTRQREPHIKALHDVWKLHTHGLILDPDTEGADMVEHALYNVEEFARDYLEANPAKKQP